MLKIKRVYDPPSDDDGKRILIDRLWPRGLSKDEAQIDEWAKNVAPSTRLRKWFSHDPGKWGEFRQRFFAELDAEQEGVDSIIAVARKGTVTLLYGSKEERYNNAVALKELLDYRMKAAERKKAS